MKHSLLFISLLLTVVFCSAQQTFIKRYKNTTQPEGSSAVCNLVGNRIAIAGNQTLASFDYVPFVIITDSAGNQLRHFVDSSCYECSVYDITSDSQGYIYIVGTFIGKAGIAKFDTTGNKVWQRELSTNGGLSSHSTAIVYRDSFIVAGGYQGHNGNTESWLLLSAYDLNGNLQWAIDSNFGNTAPEAQVGVLGINRDSNWIYATGVSYDTQPQRAIYLKVSNTGIPIVYKELPIGRKWGYGIIPLSPDSILIGGWGVTVFNESYAYVSIVDSIGNVLHTFQDSSYQSNEIVNMSYDYNDNMLYVYDFDTVQTGGVSVFHNHIGAYQFPFTSLQQPTWELTITGTDASSSRGLAIAADGTVLHTAYASDQKCPYLLKADANTCADVACDTAFVSGTGIADLFQATVRLYPNPVSSGFAVIELHSDVPLQTVEASCFDLSGRLLPLPTEGHNTSPYNYQIKLHTSNGLANGVYIIRLKLNGRYYVNSRFQVAE